ncbi:sodium:solute symporter family protein [Altererythrobacter sp. ZODW24]|uniref:sodium:solute symporter family protein n=1 Tax=Altererythrobacter sp. ZODW24 TaxID=2185142 RepID=UPI000DF80D3A|nr:sodium:solute symporter family protein [Altererythrobacter sp. ZODW24]
MDLPLLIGVLAYELIVIVGLGVWLQRRHKAGTSAEFALAGRDLPTPVVAVTLALTVLGTAHILGVFEMTWMMGAIAIWFSIAHVILLTFVCLGTGLWVRRLGVTTVPELLDRAFGMETRLFVSCIMAGVLFGILTVEAQGIGIIFATLTDWSIQTGAIVGGTLGILYVIFAGMREIGWVNLVNAVVMYLGLIAATVYIGMTLPGDGFDSVGEFYRSTGQDSALSIWGTPELLVNFAIVNVVAVLFSQSINQMLMQPAMSAKNEATVRKALWIAAPVNGLFGVFAVVIALAARAQPEFAGMADAPKVGTTAMLLDYLPPWLAAVLLASFLAAILSTFAIIALSIATIFTNDIFTPLYAPKSSAATQTRVIRIVIVVVSSIAIAVASLLPPILAAMIWLFAWLVPVFWIFVSGLLWKRHQGVAIATLLIAWAANAAWSFTSLPQVFGLESAGAYNAYVTVIVSVVVMVIGNLMVSAEPGLLKNPENHKPQETA